MRRVISIMTLALVIAFFVTCASAQEEKTEAAKPAPVKSVQTKPAPAKSSSGKVFVDEEALTGSVDEPDHHFGLARESFLKKNYATSAAEIRKGAGYLKLEMGRATKEGQRNLADAVSRLGKLAEDVEQGTVTSVDKLNMTFAHAEQALAFHHDLKAQEYWKAQNDKSAGQNLKAASKHLENSMKYAGEKVEGETDIAIKDAHDIGQKLAEGTRLAADKVGKAMQTLGKKIQEASKKIVPPKK